jgi:uncharacterized protein
MGVFSKLISLLGGNFSNQTDLKSLYPGSRALIEEAMEDIDELRDYHGHIVGIGSNHSGCFVGEAMLNPFKPISHFKFNIYLNASGVTDKKNADKQYVERLVHLITNLPKHSKMCLMALDASYSFDGKLNKRLTPAYAPNNYMYQICQTFPQYFIPCASIHPYRKDALEELDKWGQLGIKQLKWLPNTMGINPADPRCEPFYQKMLDYGITLLTHTGDEVALGVIEEFQPFGNPLLFRKPLDMGLKIIMAHCASLGKNKDLDNPQKGHIENHKLFIRLMEEDKYVGRLFGDISAIAQINRSGNPLKDILQRQELHRRLINGTDYPLPAVNAIISTRQLVNRGYISAQERFYLNKIYKANPLLFDFVLKRTLKHPQTGQKFASCIFNPNQLLGY